MRLVIADTSPVNYLILIEHIHLLPALFEKIILPTAVRTELASHRAPTVVQHWLAQPLALPDDPSLHDIDAGEAAAIRLALSLHADLLLMDSQ